ncbi:MULTISPECIES: four helix bundle protein [unclassified Pseudomonas]|uniref:four helix bundle protein n=1 Tax=unclassified Pseudomonas TaxID=196821 RepID=UPI00244A124A|nr:MULTISPECIES: four helix bundle protein [unclassified Pseudomonas]MDG9928497.1 four helix bundle protein [Pseudomonas sp. GD04042]MDH0482667.1 four helix bundle protein [Pseudomonas sp. GD04015]MDH0604631.1 four helix bundle protein [Pseudomonas sp. GD03869]MDH0894257.1 four helix bundle protein [Pseudomonas sp. GD03875]MDH1063448.1 four helix bundle protein [Pseudomonas sp. GD03985]
MAIAQHLPIYKRLAELALLVAELSAGWRRPFGRTLGERVLNECFDLSLLVFRANSATGAARVAYIQQALEGIQVVELALRLAVDLRLLSPKQHGRTVELTDDIGRQATGWKRNAASPEA